MEEIALLRKFVTPIEKVEDGEERSVYTLEDFASTFPKHQQDRYNAYRRALELHQQGELSQRAIAKELNRPAPTVYAWINEINSPPIERGIRELKALGLYPLTSDNPHLPFIALLAGWNTGDGHIPKNLYYLEFIDGEKTSLDCLRALIQKHFTKLSASIFEQQNRRSTSYKLKVNNVALAHLFATLGVPVGNKVEVPFSVPQFVLDGSDDVKRHYLAGLLGSEMRTPKLAKPHTISPITFGMSKIEPLENEHTQFLEQIKGLLGHFGISTSKITRVEVHPYNPSYRFSIDCNMKNFLRLYEDIPFRFFYGKFQAMENARNALKYHEKIAESYHLALALKAEGKSNREISNRLKIPIKTTHYWLRGKRKPKLARDTSD